MLKVILETLQFQHSVGLMHSGHVGSYNGAHSARSA